MMYAQFYQKSALSEAITEACGDRGVVIYDGRLNVEACLVDALAEAKKRGYVGAAMFKGDSFTRSHRVTPVVLGEASC